MKNIFLDNTAKVQIVLSGSVTTNQLQWTCSYYNRTLSTGAVVEWEYSGVTNNTTAVDVCPAPASGSIRVIKNITIYNADTATAIWIIQLVDWWWTKIMARNTLTTLSSWSTDDNSYYVDISWKLNIAPRVTTITSSGTPTINTDNCDAVTITAQAANITSMTTNLSGAPANFQKLIIRIKDNGTARAITRGASFEAKGIALPTTTVISKVLTVWFIYDIVTSKRWCVASAQEA